MPPPTSSQWEGHRIEWHDCTACGWCGHVDAWFDPELALQGWDCPHCEKSTTEEIDG